MTVLRFTFLARAIRSAFASDSTGSVKVVRRFLIRSEWRARGFIDTV